MFRTLLIAMAAVSVATHVSPQTTGQTTPGSLEGRVVNAQTSEPIGAASVRLYPMRTASPLPRLSATSQPDGSYRFDEVPPGQYAITGSRAGFTPSPGSTRTVRVDAGQHLTEIVVQLSAEAGLSGKVVTETGAPATGVQVVALTAYSATGRLQTRREQAVSVDQNGDYSMKDLEPGRYYVVALPSNQHAATAHHAHTDETGPEAAADSSRAPSPVRTFYPKALDLDSATPVDLTRGATTSGINIEMINASTYHVRGKVNLGLGGAAAHNFRLSLGLRDSLETDIFGKTAKADENGTFDITGVLPGEYTLWLLGAGMEGGRGASQQHLLAREDIAIEGADLNGVELSLMPPVNVIGKASAENGDIRDFSHVRVSLVPTGPVMFGVFQGVALAPDGSFGIQNMEPGRYLVRVSGGPSGSYLKSASFNRQDVTAGGIDLSQGGSGELDIVLRVGLGEVSGSVDADAAVPSAGASAILIPEQPAADGSGVLYGAIGPAGSFSIRNVPPGRYYVLAVGHWTSIWQNHDFLMAMQSEGTSIDLKENGSVHVQATLISPEQIQLNASRFGLIAP